LLLLIAVYFFSSQNNEKEFQPSAKLRVSFLSFGFFFWQAKVPCSYDF